jgi:hypothetical protein
MMEKLNGQVARLEDQAKIGKKELEDKKLK